MKELGPTGTKFLAAATAISVMSFALFAGIKVFRAFGHIRSIVTVFTEADSIAQALNTKFKRKNADATMFQTMKEKARNVWQKITSFFTTKDTVENGVNSQAKVVNATATDNLTRSQTVNTAASGKAIPVMLALAKAVLMIGVGVGAAAYGMGQLVSSFKGLEGPKLYVAAAALVALGIGVGLLVIKLGALVAGPQAAVTGAAVGVLYAIGVAVALIGAGVYFAATGMSYLVSSFVEIGKLGADVLLPLTAFVGSLALLMYAGPAGLVAAGGILASMAALATGLYAVSIVMDDEGLQNGLENLALVTTGTSAKAMTAGATTMAADLKTTVNAAMAQKIELEKF